jgi:hypothetical protein
MIFFYPKPILKIYKSACEGKIWLAGVRSTSRVMPTFYWRLQMNNISTLIERLEALKNPFNERDYGGIDACTAELRQYLSDPKAVEMVARAIAQVDESLGAGPWDYYASNPEYKKHIEHLREQAKAALAAIGNLTTTKGD